MCQFSQTGWVGPRVALMRLQVPHGHFHFLPCFRLSLPPASFSFSQCPLGALDITQWAALSNSEIQRSIIRPSLFSKEGDFAASPLNHPSLQILRCVLNAKHQPLLLHPWALPVDVTQTWRAEAWTWRGREDPRCPPACGQHSCLPLSGLETSSPVPHLPVSSRAPPSLIYSLSTRWFQTLCRALFSVPRIQT